MPLHNITLGEGHIGWRSWPGVASHYVLERRPGDYPPYEPYGPADEERMRGLDMTYYRYDFACSRNIQYMGEGPFHSPAGPINETDDPEYEELPCEDCDLIYPHP